MLNPEYNSLRSIPQFPRANYNINVLWADIDSFFERQVKIDMDPDYQRGYVWSEEQRERYIEYRLSGGISGNIIYWNCPNWSRDAGNTEWHETLELVDGKQRLRAVLSFMVNETKAFGKYLKEYDDQKYITRNRFDFEFHVNNLETKKDVVTWYIGLNNGGSVHTKEDLQVAYEILKNCE